ncbi:Transmembrane domain-containing protein [Spironucleus salmonicida]|uniref:Transmembrane domain-containing protein n=1 Tax=Spironucleus salmonicida TaxID=348837 RepID=A0A9P8LWF0_9EUKA|nr:Transmembrane domain-containing protein [Spironucleus salmonicida]
MFMESYSSNQSYLCHMQNLLIQMKQVTLYSQECQIIIIDLNNILNISYNLLVLLFYCKISLHGSILQMHHHTVQPVNLDCKIQGYVCQCLHTLLYPLMAYIVLRIINSVFGYYPQIFLHYIYGSLSGGIGYFINVWFMCLFILLLAHQIQLEVFSSSTSQCFYYYTFSLSCITRFDI